MFHIVTIPKKIFLYTTCQIVHTCTIMYGVMKQSNEVPANNYNITLHAIYNITIHTYMYIIIEHSVHATYNVTIHTCT